jgi:hypothetical protein
VDLTGKLQLKNGQALETVLPPASLSLSEVTSGDGSGQEAALIVFVTDQATLEAQRTGIVKAAERDRLTWVAYPKSGQLGTDLNRDSLAQKLLASGVQPVRQIAIDDVWSALRFRPA